jgi:hypothetical protein
MRWLSVASRGRQLRVAADERRQLPQARAGDATGDRAIEHPCVHGRRHLLQRNGGCRRCSGHLEHRRACRHVGQQPPVQREDIVGPADDRHDQLRLSGERFRALAPRGPSIDQRSGCVFAARPDVQRVPCFEHPLRHRRADVAEADPADGRQRRAHRRY